MESTAKNYISNSYQGNLNFYRHKISYTLTRCGKYFFVRFIFQYIAAPFPSSSAALSSSHRLAVCIRMFRIKYLICPHHSYKVFRIR